jgi:hypothetical protein
MRSVEAGCFTNLSVGLAGRLTSSPPQLGHIPASFCFAQVAQKVHSKEQIIASSECGGRSLLQHSQFGLSASMLNISHVRYSTYHTANKNYMPCKPTVSKLMAMRLIEHIFQFIKLKRAV